MSKKASMYNSWVGCTPMFNDDVSNFAEQCDEMNYYFDDPGLSTIASPEWCEMSHYKYAPKTMQQRLRDEWSEDEQV
jgi:hypothetical protein